MYILNQLCNVLFLVRKTGVLFKSILCLLVFSVSFPALCGDDLYLKELEAEVESSSHVADKEVSSSTKKALSAEKNKALLMAENNEKEFKAILKNELPATYNAYKKLNDNDKTQVVNLYLDSGKDVSAATRLLFNLYFKTKREQRVNNATN
ncbi:hypothetical protein MNBD_GAMMA08-796 [hydrothermal vent metagenome]|uniref:Uncharacterized protein n=1 Tax=hydrothermal vent metagenome TaxID=652676 RepID=A0A3B0X6E5_9ZZZZ